MSEQAVNQPHWVVGVDVGGTFTDLLLLDDETGATFTASVQSDDAVGFPSPTTRLTFAAATAIGAQQLTLDGPIPTDTFWRINWTIAGTTPSVTALITLGIQ